MSEVTTKKMTKEEYLLQPLPGLNKPLLRKIGEALGGRHWQSDVAREAAISKSQITRFLKDEKDPAEARLRRVPTVDFGLSLDRIMVDKIEDVVNLIGHKVSPNHGKKNVVEGAALIREGIALLRETSPRVKRAKIVSTRKVPPGPERGKKKKSKKQTAE